MVVAEVEDRNPAAVLFGLLQTLLQLAQFPHAADPAPFGRARSRRGQPAMRLNTTRQGTYEPAVDIVTATYRREVLARTQRVDGAHEVAVTQVVFLPVDFHAVGGEPVRQISEIMLSLIDAHCFTSRHGLDESSAVVVPDLRHASVRFGGVHRELRHAFEPLDVPRREGRRGRSRGRGPRRAAAGGLTVRADQKCVHTTVSQRSRKSHALHGRQAFRRKPKDQRRSVDDHFSR